MTTIVQGATYTQAWATVAEADSASVCAHDLLTGTELFNLDSAGTEVVITDSAVTLTVDSTTWVPGRYQIQATWTIDTFVTIVQDAFTVLPNLCPPVIP